MRGVIAVFALVLIAGCPARPPAKPAPATPPESPSDPPAAIQAPETEAVAPPPPATEDGFTHCCGNQRYKLEIDCADMLKRCYESVDGQWRQTFGRHCKQELGQACYLEACERQC